MLWLKPRALSTFLPLQAFIIWTVELVWELYGVYKVSFAQAQLRTFLHTPSLGQRLCRPVLPHIQPGQVPVGSRQFFLVVLAYLL